MTATYHIGTSGWHYPHWRGLFYPRGLAPDEWLPFYARQFSTVEVNNSFYRLPDLRTVRAWAEESPRAFRFAIKASRYITHMKKLADPTRSLERFLKVVDGFGAKRGPVLFQLPPHWHRDPKRLAAFLQALPRRLRCAFELRDPSWHDPEIFGLLRRHRAAFCIWELAGFRAPIQLTADFAYVRLHGPDAAYGGCYSRRALIQWASKIRSWPDISEVYIFFDNDESAYAVRNALQLKALLDGKC